MLNLGKLADSLVNLRTQYTGTNLVGNQFAKVLTQTSLAALPAAVAIQRFSNALFGQSAEVKHVEALEKKIRGMTEAEVELATEVGRKMLKMGEAEVKQTADLEKRIRGMKEADRSVRLLNKDQAAQAKDRNADIGALKQYLRVQEEEWKKADDLKIKRQNALAEYKAGDFPVAKQVKRLSKLAREAENESESAAKETNRLEDSLKKVETTQARTTLEFNRSVIERRKRQKEEHVEIIQSKNDAIKRQKEEHAGLVKITNDAIKKREEEHAEIVQSARNELSLFGTLGRAIKASESLVIPLAPLALAITQSISFNHSLIEANSNLEKRQELFSGALDVQMRTGASMSDTVDLMKEMRSQTQLYLPNWIDIAAIASKLHQGLGASTSEIGAMLNASRALRISFQDLADSVTNIVDRTSLSVRETMTLVTELRRVLTGFNVSAKGGALDGPLRHLAALEQAMKARGATEGAALRVLSPLTRMTQAGGMGMMFGSGGPDFLRDPQRTAQMTSRLADYLKQFRNAPLIFEQIAAQFNISADEAQIFIDSAKEAGKVEAELGANKIDLEKRYANQVAASGRVWAQTANNLRALLIEGLSPVTQALGWLNTKLVSLRESLDELRQVMPDWSKTVSKVGIFVTVVGSIGFVAVKAYRNFMLLQKALEVIAGTGAAANIIKAAATARGLAGLAPAVSAAAGTGSLVGPATSAAGGSMVGSASTFIKGLLPALALAMPTLVLLLPILIPVVVAAVLGVYLLRKWSDNEEKKNLMEMTAMRHQLEKGDVRKAMGVFAHKALDVNSGVEAARNLEAGLPDQLNTWVSGLSNKWDAASGKIIAPKFAQDKNVLSGELVEVRQRLAEELATKGREERTASQQRLNEINEGISALGDLLVKLTNTQKELVDKQIQIGEKNKRLEATAAHFEKLKAEVKDQSMWSGGQSSILNPR